MRASLITISVAGALLWGRPAHADTETFADQSPLLWGVTALELYAPLALAFADARSEDCQSDCTPAVLAVTTGMLALPTLVGVSAAYLDLDPDVAFVTHNAIWGGATGALLVAGVASLVSDEDLDEVPPWLVLMGGVYSAAAAGTYAALRGDSLDQGPPTAGLGLLTWGPPLAIGLGALVSALLFGDRDSTHYLIALIPALASTAVYAVAAATIETARN